MGPDLIRVNADPGVQQIIESELQRLHNILAAEGSGPYATRTFDADSKKWARERIERIHEMLITVSSVAWAGNT